MSRPKKWLTAGVAALALVGIGRATTSGDSESASPAPQPPAAEAPAVPGPADNQQNQENNPPAPSEFDQREQQVIEEMQMEGRAAALSILNDLGQPQSGARPYDHTRVGNKAPTLGPDMQQDTADDAQFSPDLPEMFVAYDPVTREIYINSVSEHGRGPEAVFYNVQETFQAAPNSPITLKSEDLTLEDFRAAINDQGTTLLQVSTENAWGYNEETKVSTGLSSGIRIVNGKVHAGGDSTEVTTVDDLNSTLDQFSNELSTVTAQLAQDTAAAK